MLTGGCSCGKVRYEAAGEPFDACLCHCADCRRVAAAPVVAWFSVKASQLRFVHGEPKRFAFSAKAVRAFCPDCGTALTYQADATPDVVDITLCSLDEPERLPPADHVRTGEKLSWLHLSDDLPAYRVSRAEG